MTLKEKYKDDYKKFNAIFQPRKDINETVKAVAHENIMTVSSDTVASAHSHWALVGFTSSQFLDVYDNLEQLSVFVRNSLRQINERIAQLEKATKELGGKISSDDITSVAKFAQDFNNQIEESKKKLIEYKKKMKENDLAT